MTNANKRRFVASINPVEIWLDPDYPSQQPDSIPTGSNLGGPRTSGHNQLRLEARPSRENAMKHGAYAREVPFISFGPLREDPEEVAAFYKGVEADLQPGTSTTLNAQVREIANLQWKLLRLEKWEVDGYSVPEGQTEVYEPDKSMYFALERELACEVLDSLGDPTHGSPELRRALVALVQVTEDAESDYLIVVNRLRGVDRVLSTLISFIDRYYGTVGRAYARLAAEASRHHGQDREGRLWDSLVGARVETSSDFTRCLLDAKARTSRELDRALARYRLTKETLMSME